MSNAGPGNLPIFDNRSVLQPQKVASGAEGTENVAQLFGNVAKAGVEIVGQQLEAESKANLYMQGSLIGQALTDYELSLKADPDPKKGAVHLQTLKNSLNISLNEAKVNNHDRGELRKQIAQSVTAADKSLGIMTIEQAKKSAQLNWAARFPDSLKNIAANLMSDPKEAQRLISNNQFLLAEMFRRNDLTKSEYEKYNKVMEEVVDRGASIISRGGELGITAAEFHQAGAFFAGDNKNIPGGAPIDVNTRLMYGHLKSEMDFKTAQAGLYDGNRDPGAIMFALVKATDDQFVKFIKTADGVSRAKGMIDSGHPIGGMEQRVEYLNSRKADTLTDEETAERNMLSKWLSDLKNNYIGTIQGTPAGQEINSEYLGQLATIRDSFGLDPNQAQQMEREATNAYRTNLVNLGRAQGISQDIIQPFDAQSLAEMQSFFNPGTDAAKAINRLQALTPENAAYMAYGMKNPNEKQTYLIASVLGDDKRGLAQQLIVANQKGHDFTPLNFGKGGNINEQKLKAKVISQLGGITTYLGHQSGSADSISGVYDATMNMVKFLALSNGDLNLDNVKSYINDAITTVSSAYKIEKGSFYSFNVARQPMSKQDSLSVASYVRDQAMKHYGEGMSKESLALSLDSNPLHVSMDESGMVNVTDSSGAVRWQEVYTETLLGAARLEYRASQQTLDQRKADFPIYGGNPVIQRPSYTGARKEG